MKKSICLSVLLFVMFSFMGCKPTPSSKKDGKIMTVEKFLETMGDTVTTITADSSNPGITFSEDKTIVNVYGIKLTGEFGKYGNNGFPSNLVSADLSGLDTSKVTDMDCMFMLCKSLEKLDLRSFDTSSVEHTDLMFSNCGTPEKTCEVTINPTKWTLGTDLASFGYGDVYISFSTEN